MKNVLPYIIIICLSCIILFRPGNGSLTREIVCDTVYSTDTVFCPVPVASSERIIDSVSYPVFIPMPGDTVHDTVFVYIPISQKVYKDSLYTAWVSGYRANLDSIKVYQKAQTIFIRDKLKRKRLGVGVQLGYGYPFGMYAGIGISYNLFQFQLSYNMQK